jgi:hypothetical protein
MDTNDLPNFNNEIDEDIITRPIYMSLMETLEGKPQGYPIWNTFQDQPSRRSMNNETLSSTFISLSNILSNISEDVSKDGQIMQVSLKNITYNIYLPHPEDDFQIAFVVVFEEKESHLISTELRKKLARKLVKTLRSCKPLRTHLNESSNKPIPSGGALHEEMNRMIDKSLLKWSSSLD